MGAYYKRNNSFSRSYNAECAENEGRLPRLRAAKELGISAKAFDVGYSSGDYTTSEWHHVGKYANKIDYYDTNEILIDFNFWLAVKKFYKTKKMKAFCDEKIRPLIRSRLFEKLSPGLALKKEGFKHKLKVICGTNMNKLKTIVNYVHKYHIQSKNTVFVKYGTYEQEEMRFSYNGSPYYTGKIEIIADGKHIAPFSLNPKIITSILRSASKDKYQTNLYWAKKDKIALKYHNIRRNVKAILNRRIRGVIHSNSLIDIPVEHFEIAAKITEKLYSETHFVERNENKIYINSKSILLINSNLK